MAMNVGTKSVLFGAHCFLLHPWFVAAAWWKLYGFPWDPRLWVAFFVHDLGYLGKPNMDGVEGETHPVLGARLMRVFGPRWSEFCLTHSRYYAKALGKRYSRLCVADKLAFVLTPAWLYLPMARATGEIYEYLSRARTADSAHGRWKAADYSRDLKLWHRNLCEYMTAWAMEHRDGAEDTWTAKDRHARTASGVCQ